MKRKKKIDELSDKLDKLADSVNNLRQSVENKPQPQQEDNGNGQWKYETDNTHARHKTQIRSRPMNPYNPYGLYL